MHQAAGLWHVLLVSCVAVSFRLDTWQRFPSLVFFLPWAAHLGPVQLSAGLPQTHILV